MTKAIFVAECPPYRTVSLFHILLVFWSLIHKLIMQANGYFGFVEKQTQFPLHHVLDSFSVGTACRLNNTEIYLDRSHHVSTVDLLECLDESDRLYVFPSPSFKLKPFQSLIYTYTYT